MAILKKIAAFMACVLSLLAAIHANGLLEWTIEDSGTLYSLAPLMRDHFWWLELGIATGVFVLVTVVKRTDAGIALWLAGNFFIWQFSMTFACLEMATKMTNVFINGSQVGKPRNNTSPTLDGTQPK